MRLIVLSLAVVAVSVASVFLVGWLLPATREGRAEIIIAAPPQRVRNVIADVEAQTQWRDVAAVTRTEDGWVEVTARGERIAFVVEEMGQQRIRLGFSSDAGYSGVWEAVLEDVPGGTRMAVLEQATVPSPVGRILARLMFDPIDFAPTYLMALKTRVET